MGLLSTLVLLGNGLSFVTLFLTLFLLIRQLITIKHRYPLILLSSLIVLNILTFFFNIYPTLFPNSEGYIIEIFGILETLLFGFIFWIAIEFFAFFSGGPRDKWDFLNLFMLTSVIAFSVFSIIFSRVEAIYELVVYEDVIILSWGMISSILLLTYFLIFAIRSFFDLKVSQNNAIDDQQRSQIKIMMIGFYLIDSTIVLGILGSIAEFAFGNTFLYIFLVFSLQRFLIAIGFSFIAYGYLSPGEIAYLQPMRMDQLLVIHGDGIPLVEYEFSSKSQQDASLVSGAITAITALMTEAFGVTGSIKSINFEDKILLLTFRENVGFVLVTSELSSFLNNSLNNFADRFSETYDLSGTITNVSKYEHSIPDLRRSFGLSH